jgi:hypothetical protein
MIIGIEFGGSGLPFGCATRLFFIRALINTEIEMADAGFDAGHGPSKQRRPIIAALPALPIAIG